MNLKFDNKAIETETNNLEKIAFKVCITTFKTQNKQEVSKELQELNLNNESQEYVIERVKEIFYNGGFHYLTNYIQP